MKATFFALLILGSLSGCQTLQSGSGGDNSAINGPKKELALETRTWISESCLLTSDDHVPKVGIQSLSGAIAAVLLPKAIEFVIDSAVEDLKEIKKIESVSSVEFNSHEYDPLENRYPVAIREFGCLTSITARFEEGTKKGGLIEKQLSSKPGEIKFDETSENDISQLIKARLALFGINISGDYEQVLEVSIVDSDDKSAFRLENQFFHSKALLGGKKNAQVIYSYALKGPGAIPNGSSYFVASIDIGMVKPPFIIKPSEKSRAKTGWISNIGLSKGSLDAFYRNKFGDEPVASPYGPVELTVKNTQLRKPSDAAKFFASVLEASKDTIRDAIVERVLPEDKAAELQDAEIALKASEIEYNAAVLKDDKDAIELAILRFNKACDLVTELEGKSCKQKELE